MVTKISATPPAKVTITWDTGVTRFANIAKAARPSLDAAGLYCLLGAKHDPIVEQWNDIVLLYIGQAYNQTLRQRIPQPHSSRAFLNATPKAEIVVMVGAIKASTLQAFTGPLYDDVESCLIIRNPPRCNVMARQYAGRTLSIHNVGDFYPLAEDSECP